MRADIKGLGDVGLITDRDAHDLPPNGWSSLHNIRCIDGAIEPVIGYTDATTGTAAISPSGSTQDIHVHQMVTLSDDSFWFVFALDADDDGDAEKIYKWNGETGTAVADITRTSGDYTGSADDLWVMSEFNGLMVATNGRDGPQYWGSAMSNAAPLPYDGSTVWKKVGAETGFDTDNTGGVNNYTCKVIRAFKKYLFALNITEDSTNYSTMVHWSNPADPGAAPDSWDYNEASNDAGRTVLPETKGKVLDLLPLGDVAIVYKDDAIYRCSFVGGQFIFDFDLITTSHGLWATNCVVDIGGAHVVMGDGVVYMHSGGEIKNILEGKVADQLFTSIDETEYEKTFLFHRKSENEVWICYPEQNQLWCNKAMIWNYINNTWHTRDIPKCSTIKGGVITQSTTDEWDDESSLDWDDEFDKDWASRNYSPLADTPVAAEQQLVKFEGITSDDALAERDGIVIDQVDDWHMIRRIFPRATGDAFSVCIGDQSVIGAPVNWCVTQTFTPATDHKLDARVTGRAFAMRITGSADWKMSEIGFDFVKAGRR